MKPIASPRMRLSWRLGHADQFLPVEPDAAAGDAAALGLHQADGRLHR